MSGRVLKPLAAALAARFPAVLALAAVGASAQTAADLPPDDAAVTGRGLTITPRFAATQTFSDNGNLDPGNEKQADSITVLTPGVSLRSVGGRVKGFLDYSLNGILYARGSGQSQLQNQLNAAGTAEAVENFAYVDASANISQQAVSAFGKQSVDPTLGNSNRTEVATYSLSPYIRGNLPGDSNYEIRLTRAGTRSDDIANGYNSTTSSGSARVSGGTKFSALNWSADVSRSLTDYGASGKTQDTQGRVALDYSFTPEFKTSINGGYESENLTSDDLRSGANYGGGFEWHPTERTLFSADVEHRLFGSSHNIRFEHRTPLTVWSYTDVRDVVTGNGQPLLGSLGSAYNVYFNLFASQQPDPILRQQLVNSFLQKYGIDPSSTVVGQFLSNSVTLQRNQELSFALIGKRDTLTFLASRTDATQLQNSSGSSDDFDNTTAIRQTGFSVSLAHQLTPISSINLTLAQQHTTGSETVDLRSVRVDWTSQLNKNMFVSLGARHQEARSDTSPYTESAVYAGLRLQF